MIEEDFVTFTKKLGFHWKKEEGALDLWPAEDHKEMTIYAKCTDAARQRVGEGVPDS